MKNLDYTFMDSVLAHNDARLQAERQQLDQEELERKAKKLDITVTAITILAILGALCLETPH